MSLQEESDNFSNQSTHSLSLSDSGESIESLDINEDINKAFVINIKKDNPKNDTHLSKTAPPQIINIEKYCQKKDKKKK